MLCIDFGGGLSVLSFNSLCVGIIPPYPWVVVVFVLKKIFFFFLILM